MRYNPALDGIRALAVLAVVAHHALVPGFENGRGGVDVFFVLSGFLITSLLAAEEAQGGIRLGAFYLRRARRLYPALLVLVGLVLAFAPAWRSPPTRGDTVVALLYLSDFASASGAMGDVLKITWSLSVEEHFYLLWPLAVMGLCRLPRRSAIRVLLLSYVLATCWRYYVYWNASDPWIAYYRFDTRLSGLLLGSILALAPRVRLPYAAMTGVLAAVVLTSTQGITVTILLSEWLGACFVLWALNGSRLLTVRPLPYIGRISYGVYLFHWPIALLFQFHTTWPMTLAWTLCGSVALAALSYHTIERAFRSKPSRRLVGSRLPI